jgi:hypothetical protein
MAFAQLKPQNKQSVLNSSVSKSIIKTLAYFDVFSYPITFNEIYEYASIKSAAVLFEEELNILLKNEVIFKTGDFYALSNNPLLAIKRNNENRLATEQLPQAIKVGKFIGKLPFVKAVGISGSLSKNVAYDNSDFDYFIITETNRLYVCRFILGLYRRFTKLLKKEYHVCCNYIIDENHLIIPEKNIYTAIEIASLIPVAGKNVLLNFYYENNWRNATLPNERRHIIPATKKIILKQSLEILIGNIFGNILDSLFRKIAIKRFNNLIKKGKNYNKRGLCFAQFDKHICKNTPGTFQNKLLDKYKKRLQNLESKWNINLETEHLFSL